MKNDRDYNASNEDPEGATMDDVDVHNAEDSGLIGGVPRVLTGGGPISQPIGAFEGNFGADDGEQADYERVESDDRRGTAATDAPDTFAGSGSTSPPSSPHERAVLEAEREEHNPR